jgi:hypothetical protein
MEHAIDIVVPVGSEVYAATAGKVTDASEDDDGYKDVDIDHDDGTYTNYGHLMVSVSEELPRGRLLSIVVWEAASRDSGQYPEDSNSKTK